METADLVVVGAGIAGVSAAYWGTRVGLRVALVDTGQPGGGATGFAAANIRCHHTNPIVAQFAIEARDLFANWDDAIGGDCGFRRIGGLFIVPPEEEGKLRANVEMLRGLGLNTVAVDGGGLRELQPFMASEDVGAAAYEPDSGYADPSLALASLLERAREGGARFMFGRGPVGLRVDGGQVTGVRAGGEELSSPQTVLAAGAASRALAAEAGVDLPVHPFPLGAGILSRPAPVGPPMATIDRALGLWYRADREDAVLVEAGYEGIDVTDTKALEALTHAAPPGRQALVESAMRLSSRIPGLGDAVPGRTWAGLDSCTPDGFPVLGPAPEVDGLQLLTGANGVFIRLGPVYARALVDSIVRGDFAMSPIAPFGLGRFAAGTSLAGANDYGAGSFS